ncbi:MAG: phosphatase PAP2 family protein [Candidatus Eisenbacteria bacterium]|uniref:Phosphatase PAP2 family protein n=1 Tax=Eiseniibacteriota bacterium TaxID=2212470 RepID=A0A538U891_UNCEI|nr:MAG: phosphatase PAP2 family protein [Candidatus Eisenbacteria bacterium]
MLRPARRSSSGANAKGGPLNLPVVLAIPMIGFHWDPVRINDAVGQALNNLAGRSRLLDDLLYLGLHNDLAKGAVIGACFFAAWFGHASREDLLRARAILLTTLAAAALVLATTKTMSHVIVLPRPAILSQRLYLLEGDQLREQARLPFRVPLDGWDQTKARTLSEGQVLVDDLGGFPSDHAGLFVTLALGIWVVSRAAGAIALFWTFGVILAGKIITGQHSLFDVVAGTAMAVLGLAICLGVASRWLDRPLERLANWTLRHGAFASALIFLVMFEVGSTLDHLPDLATAILKGLKGR